MVDLSIAMLNYQRVHDFTSWQWGHRDIEHVHGSMLVALLQEPKRDEA